MYYVYAHTKPDGEIFYIGKGTRRRAWDKQHRNQFWKNIVNKYGFESQVLAYWDTEKEAFEHEKLLIACFKDLNYKLANLSEGGEGATGYKYTQDQLEKRKGANNGMFGKKRTKEELQKISEGTKKAMSDSKIKDKLKKANKKENNPNFGKIAHNAKSVNIEGILYTSQTAAAKALNMSLSDFIRKAKSGKIKCQFG